jgi:hypothetical protein
MHWNWVTSPGVMQASSRGASAVQAILPCANSVWKITADEKKSLSTPPVGTGMVRGAQFAFIGAKRETLDRTSGRSRRRF